MQLLFPRRGLELQMKMTTTGLNKLKGKQPTVAVGMDKNI